MESVVQLLAFILPIIAFLSVVLVVFVNLYLKIRRQFLVKVNCWFCNQWTKVHYDEQNNFECPTCLQYNGFTSDGDYNKPIPAQQDELLNQQVAIPKQANNYPCSASNGLCHLCNNNQQLKIYQLANFIPLNEANYDVEIEHFQKQLEKAYKLCPPCKGVVKTTLHKQSCFFGLKLTQLRKKGLLLLDLNNSHNGISKQAKWSFLKSLIHYTLIGFAVLNLVFVISRIDFSDRNLKSSTPKFISVQILKLKEFFFMVLNAGLNMSKDISTSTGLNLLYENVAVTVQNLKSIFLEAPLLGHTLLHFNTTLESFVKFSELYCTPELPKVENTVFLCFVGLLFQGILLLLNDNSSFRRKLFQFTLWIILGFVHWRYPSKKYFNAYLNSIQILTSTIIIASMIYRQNPKRFKQRKLKRISKPRSKESCQLGELSDNEELNDFASFNSTFKLDNSFNTAIPKCSKPVFGQPAILEDQLNNKQSFYDVRSNATAKQYLNHSFTSAKTHISDQTSLPDTVSVFSNSFMNHTPPNSMDKDIDIDISLNKLHLGSPIMKKTPTRSMLYTNNDVNRPRPVLSPAKLKNVTQNSWVAGGFWRDSNGVLMPLNTYPNLSRSSSQTSGFVSQTGPLEPNNFNSLPSSVNNSFCGDFECNSVFSEPAYYMNGSYVMQGRNLSSRFAGHSDLHRTFYPILNHEQLVYFTPYALSNVFSNNSSPNKSTFGMSGAVNPNNINKTYKPGSPLKDWVDI